MAQLFVEIGAKISGFQRQLTKIERRVNRFSRNMERLGTNLTQSVTLPLIGLGTASVATFAQFDKLEKGLGAIAGSAEEGKRQLNDLLEVVKDVRTTIDLKAAATGSLQLQAVGISADRAKESLRQLAIAATVSGGSSDDVAEVARQLAQAAAKGNILQQELRIILERIPALAGVIKNEFGTVTAEGLRDAGVSADEFISRLTKAIAENEKFANVQASLSKEIETFKINLQLAGKELGQSIANAINLQENLRRLSGFIGDLVKSFSLLSPAQQKSIVNWGLLAAAIGPAIFVFSKIVGAVGSVIGAFKSLRAVLVATSLTAGPVLAILAGLAAAAGGILLLKKQFDSLTAAVRSSNNVLAAAEAQANLEIRSAKGLVNILTDETASREAKERALKSLQEKYPDYFSNLDVEKSSVGDITEAYNKFKTSILEVSKARAAEAKLIELATREQELLAEQKQIEADAELTGLRAFLKRQTAGAGKDAIVLRREQTNKALEELAKEQQLILDIFNDANDKLNQDGIEGAGGDDAKSLGDSLDISEVLAKLKADFKVLDNQAALLGGSLENNISKKSDLARSALNQLLEGGVSPNSEAVKGLVNIIKGFRTEVDSVDGLALAGLIPETLEPTTRKVAENIGLIGRSLQSLGAVADVTLGEGKGKIAEKMERLKDITQEWAEVVSGVLTEGFTDFFNTLIEGGGNAFDGFINAIKKLVVQLAAAVATAAALALLFTIISGGTAEGLTKIKGLLGFSEGSLFKNFLNIPGFAEGGIVPPGYPNDSYFARLSSGEAVIPLNKINQYGGGAVNVTGEFRLQGNDLVAAVVRNQQNRERTRGR